MSRLLASGVPADAVRRLRDAGLEVVYLDRSPAAEVVAAIAVQEDVEAVAVGDPEHGAGLVEVDQDVVVFWVT